MHELVRATFGALEDANLPDLVKLIRDRVFLRGPDDLLVTTVERGVCHWSFKPMVELLLRHSLELAANTQIPLQDRRIEITATLELAGF